MKKFITYSILYAISCILQFSFGKYLNADGIFPNLILIVVAYLGLTKGIVAAETMGFLFGITWDVFSTDIFGMRAVMFTIVGYFIGAISKNFDRDMFPSQIVVTLLANTLYCLGFSFICWILPVDEGGVEFLITIQSIFKIFATVLFAPIVFFTLDRLKLFPGRNA